MRLYRIPGDRVDGNALATALVNRLGARARVFEECVDAGLSRVLIVFDALGTQLNVVDDDRIGGQYLEIEAERVDAADQLDAALHDVVRVRPFAVVLADAVQHPHDPALLARAAIASGNVPDDALLTLLRERSRNDDAAVRHGAYHAAGMTQWPQAVPIVAAGLDDADVTNRDYARRVFASLQAAGVVPGEQTWQD